MTFFSPFVALAGLGSSSVVVNSQLVAPGPDSPRAPLLDYSLRGCPVEHLGFTGLGCTCCLTNGGCSNGSTSINSALVVDDAAAAVGHSASLVQSLDWLRAAIGYALLRSCTDCTFGLINGGCPNGLSSINVITCALAICDVAAVDDCSVACFARALDSATCEHGLHGCAHLDCTALLINGGWSSTNGISCALAICDVAAVEDALGAVCARALVSTTRDDHIGVTYMGDDHIGSACIRMAAATCCTPALALTTTVALTTTLASTLCATTTSASPTWVTTTSLCTTSACS